MSIEELKDAISAMEQARSAVFTVGLRLDTARLCAASAEYVLALNEALGSCNRALSQRLEDGEAS